MIQGEVLAHPTRKRIYFHIVENPGITFKMLRSVFGLNDGTLNYHLDYLRKNDLIEVRTRKHERIYVPMGETRSKDLAEGQRKVLAIIKERPGCDTGSIRARSGLGKKETARVLNLLSKKGLVKGRREGSSHVYSPATEDELYRVLMMALMDKYSSGEISLERLLILKNKMKEMKDKE